MKCNTDSCQCHHLTSLLSQHYFMYSFTVQFRLFFFPHFNLTQLSCFSLCSSWILFFFHTHCRLSISRLPQHTQQARWWRAR